MAALNGSARRIERYPGSATLAMLELGASASYLLCDLDPGSVSDLCAASARLGLDAQVDVRQRDGMTEIADALASLATDDRVIVHVDPYEPSAAGPGGMSALDLAAALITAGVGLVYWYGYDRPEDRGWAFDRLSSDAPAGVLWSGDMMVTSATSAPHGGHFGTATTPGTGCGLVCANLSSEAIAAAQRLGDELVAAYDGAALPHGSPGRLDFTVL